MAVKVNVWFPSKNTSVEYNDTELLTGSKAVTGPYGTAFPSIVKVTVSGQLVVSFVVKTGRGVGTGTYAMVYVTVIVEGATIVAKEHLFITVRVKLIESKFEEL